MYEPIRGGTRGGQAEFKWSDVSADKDREHYLGHSINAPTGRWQKNKDVHWYNREGQQTETERQAEIRRIKEAEAEALTAILGFTPTNPTEKKEGQSSTSAAKEEDPVEAEARRHEKEERRQRKSEKAARKEEKRRRKAEKREQGRDNSRGRSRSPSWEARRRDRERESHPLSRSRSPPRRRHDTGDSRPPVTYRESRYSPPPRPRHYSHSRSRSPVNRRRGSREGVKHDLEHDPSYDDRSGRYYR